jgi:hypothetical protein
LAKEQSTCWEALLLPCASSSLSSGRPFQGTALAPTKSLFIISKERLQGKQQSRKKMRSIPDQMRDASNPLETANQETPATQKAPSVQDYQQRTNQQVERAHTKGSSTSGLVVGRKRKMKTGKRARNFKVGGLDGRRGSEKHRSKATLLSAKSN